jgi:hypothetical protein
MKHWVNQPDLSEIKPESGGFIDPHHFAYYRHEYLSGRAKSRKYLVRDCARNKKRQHNDPADDKRDKNAHRQARNSQAATTRVNLSAGSIR